MGLKFLLLGLVLAVMVQVSMTVLTLKAVSTLAIPYDIVPRGGKTVPMYGLNRGAAEKSALDADNMIAYTAGHKFLHLINFTDIFAPKIQRSFRLTAPVLDIAECGNLVAFTSRNPIHITNPGMVHIYQKYPVFDSVCNMTVGSNPKSLKFNFMCDTIIIANEGPAAENLETEMFVNPEGTVSVVRVNNTMVHPGMSMCPTLPLGSDVREIDFRLFNDPTLAAFMERQFIRNTYQGQMDGDEHTFSMNVEPEYVTLDPWFPIAYVSLQENNAVAEVNYANMTAVIHPMGLKNWTNVDIDASSVDGTTGRDRRAITYRKYPIESFMQPDAIELFEANGEVFLVTANEGAPISMLCESCEIESEYIEFEQAQELAGDYLLSQNVPAEVRKAMSNPRELGQLRISMVDGLREPGEELVDRPIFYGGRGISMFRITRWGLDLVWDSGDSISKGIMDLKPNAHNHPPFGDPEIIEARITPQNLINRRWDWWSPFTGPECQSLAIGSYNMSHKIIIVGINGAHALGIFSVPLYGNFTEPQFESVYRDGENRAKARMNYNQLYRNDLQKLQNANVGLTGDLDPDSIVFISPEKTRGRVPLVMVTSRVSGTISLYQIQEIPRAQLLREQRTALGAAASKAPSTGLPLVISLIAIIYITSRH